MPGSDAALFVSVCPQGQRSRGAQATLRLELMNRLKCLFIQHVVTEYLLHVLRARNREGKVKVKVMSYSL